MLTNGWMVVRAGQDASPPTKDGHDRKVEIFHSAANPDAGDHDNVGQQGANMGNQEVFWAGRFKARARE